MTILTTHKNELRYVEHCKVVSRDARLSFVQSEGAINKSFSLPHLNLAIILMGPGTSISQSAAKLAAEEGILFAFSGGGCSPLLMASQSEYRPSEYLQNWIGWWQHEDLRLKVAKHFQNERIKNVASIWVKHYPEYANLCSSAIAKYSEQITYAKNTNELLGYEGNFTKSLYRSLANYHNLSFKREPGEKTDLINEFLDNGNYIAYGYSASALWVMGIPPSLSVIHGKTRRGALVFDLADVYKDALVLPSAFKHGANNEPASYYRSDLTEMFHKTKSFKNMFEIIKNTSNLSF